MDEHDDSRKQKTHQKEENDDFSIDFSGIKKFFTPKILNALFIILLLLIPIAFTIYIRAQPWNMPATDQWAMNSVENYYKNNIAQQVNAQYPNLPQQQKNNLIEKQWSEFEKQNSAQLKQQITETSNYFKTGFQYQENSNTYTFLGDLDSYFYLRRARNIVDKGMPCDEIRDGVCIDNHMIAPIGTLSGYDMHAYGTAYLYQIMHFLNPKINLMQSAFMLPTLIAILAVIGAFFLGRKLLNDAAGFFSAMLIAVSPMILSRTMGSDTDIWNITFPLFIIWAFLEAFEAKTWIKITILISVAGLLIGMFSFAWGGYWYVFYFIIAALLGYISFEIIKSYIKHRKLAKTFNKELSGAVIMLGLLVLTSIIFVSAFNSLDFFRVTMIAPFNFATGINVAALEDLWPNILTTVAELNDADINTIVTQTSFGIRILFSIALLGIILTMVKKKPDFKEYILIGSSALLYIFLTSVSGVSIDSKLFIALLILPVLIAGIFLLRGKDNEIDVKPALILTIWFIGMIYTSLTGVRFIVLLIPAFCMALGYAFGYIFQYLNRLFNESWHMPRSISIIVTFLLLCLILITPIQQGIATGKSFMPSMTKGWWDSLTGIRDKSAPDAIITSWWDFGHWFKYVADRQVTFDGASQYPALGFWVGKSLRTNSENETVGIIRMLNCGSNNAFVEVNKRFNDTEKSQNIVGDMIVMSKNSAEKYLKEYGFNDDEIAKILALTHCNPRESYFITSEDMVGKAGVWAHFGSWDIDKAYIINNIKPKPPQEGIRLLKERFNYSDDEAGRIYYEVQSLQTDRQMNDWIAPWPSYAGGRLISCENRSEMVQCTYNMGISNNGQTLIVLEKAVLNISSPENSQLMLGFYDQNNRRIQESIGTFNELVIIDKTIKKYRSSNATLGLAMLLDVNHDENSNQTSYRSLIADPLLIDSSFTKLFYLDGKGMKHFEKFSDITDITGTRIIVWKINWDLNETFSSQTQE